jgi:hypothetical protein
MVPNNHGNPQKDGLSELLIIAGYSVLSVEHHISLGSDGNPPEYPAGHLVTR